MKIYLKEEGSGFISSKMSSLLLDFDHIKLELNEHSSLGCLFEE